MERRNFIKTVGFIAISLGIAKFSFSKNQSLKTRKVYDHEPPIWGSPYYGDTQSILDFRSATFEQIQKELAHFHMSEKPRDVYLFELNW